MQLFHNLYARLIEILKPDLLTFIMSKHFNLHNVINFSEELNFYHVNQIRQ